MNEDQEKLFGPDKLKQLRSDVPAITHIDYSARIQTVDAETSPRFHRIIKAFHELTGYPLVVNTSFNIRGEPIVGTPQDAYRCFMYTDIDVLILENCICNKEEQPEMEGADEYKNKFLQLKEKKSVNILSKMGFILRTYKSSLRLIFSDITGLFVKTKNELDFTGHYPILIELFKNLEDFEKKRIIIFFSNGAESRFYNFPEGIDKNYKNISINSENGNFDDIHDLVKRLHIDDVFVCTEINNIPKFDTILNLFHAYGINIHIISDILIDKHIKEYFEQSKDYLPFKNA